MFHKSFLVMSLLTLGLLPQLSRAQDSIEFPALTGDYAVGKTQYHLIDEARPEIFTDDPNDVRELMVTVYYPADPAPDMQLAPYANEELASLLLDDPAQVEAVHAHAYANAPVADAQNAYQIIIFSPGMGNLPLFYTSTLEDIASHGYVVAALWHPYSTAVTAFPDGRLVAANEAGSPLPPENMAQTADIQATGEARDRVGAVWVGDALFTLDQLEILNQSDALLGGHLDLTRVGIFGHSFGGATAAEANYMDSRFQAGINMDGSPFGSTATQGIQQPFMLMLSDDVVSEAAVPSDEELAAIGMTRDQFEVQMGQSLTARTVNYDLAQTGYLVTLKGSMHNTFTTDFLLLKPLFPDLISESDVGTIDPSRAITIINSYIIGFFDQYLKGESSPFVNAAPADYPEISFESKVS